MLAVSAPIGYVGRHAFPHPVGRDEMPGGHFARVGKAMDSGDD